VERCSWSVNLWPDGVRAKLFLGEATAVPCRAVPRNAYSLTDRRTVRYRSSRAIATDVIHSQLIAVFNLFSQKNAHVKQYRKQHAKKVNQKLKH